MCVEPHALDYLSELRDRSLILAEETGDSMRYRMLETLREFAHLQLSDQCHGETAKRHAEYFAGFAREANGGLHSETAAYWRARFDEEHDNCRAALAWSISAGDMELVARLINAIWRCWAMRGHIREGLGWIEEITKTLPVSDSPHAGPIYQAAGALAWFAGDYARAQTYYETGLIAYQKTGDRQGEAHTLHNIGLVCYRHADLENARSYQERALAIFREIGHDEGTADSVANMGMIAVDAGDYERAKPMLEESLRMRLAMNNKRGALYSMHNLANALCATGDLERAIALYNQSLSIAQEVGDRSGEALSHTVLADILRRSGDNEAAMEHATRGCALSSEIGDQWGVASGMAAIGSTALACGDTKRALENHRQALRLRVDAGNPAEAIESIRFLLFVNWSLEEYDKCARWLGAVETAYGGMSVKMYPSDAYQLKELYSRLEKTLGKERLDYEYSRGTKLDWREVAAEVLGDG